MPGQTSALSLCSQPVLGIIIICDALPALAPRHMWCKGLLRYPLPPFLCPSVFLFPSLYVSPPLSVSVPRAPPPSPIPKSLPPYSPLTSIMTPGTGGGAFGDEPLHLTSSWITRDVKLFSTQGTRDVTLLSPWSARDVKTASPWSTTDAKLLLFPPLSG